MHAVFTRVLTAWPKRVCTYGMYSFGKGETPTTSHTVSQSTYLAFIKVLECMQDIHFLLVALQPVMDESQGPRQGSSISQDLLLLSRWSGTKLNCLGTRDNCSGLLHGVCSAGSNLQSLDWRPSALQNRCRVAQQPLSEVYVRVTGDQTQIIHQLDNLFLMVTWLKKDLTISICTRIQIPNKKG